MTCNVPAFARVQSLASYGWQATFARVQSLASYGWQAIFARVQSLASYGWQATFARLRSQSEPNTASSLQPSLWLPVLRISRVIAVRSNS